MYHVREYPSRLEKKKPQGTSNDSKESFFSSGYRFFANGSQVVF